MNKKLEDIFENCFKALENCTEEDIRKMQELYDKEVGRYSNIIPNQEFEILCPPTPFTDKGLLEIHEEANFYNCQLETSDEYKDIQKFYIEKDTWESINFSDDYKEVA